MKTLAILALNGEQVGEVVIDGTDITSEFTGDDPSGEIVDLLNTFEQSSEQIFVSSEETWTDDEPNYYSEELIAYKITNSVGKFDSLFGVLDLD